MNAELAARGYGMVVRHVGDDLAVALHALRELVQHGVRGIIWSPLSTPQYQADNLQLTQAIMDSGLPAVAVDRYPEEIEVNSVVSDNAHAGYLLTKYLLERGHRRIGLLRHSYGSTPADRHRGYLRALREYGVTPAEPWVMYVDHQLPRTELVAYLRDWLRTVPLTAVWSIAGNPLGMAVLAAALAAGLRVPDDLSVATFDEIIAPFPVTAIMQPLTAIGQRAAALLCDAIEHPSPEIQRIILRSRLVEGSSCLPLSPVPSHETIRVAGSA
jgi:LacI family fructose operon transcriptional repressor